MKALKLFVFCLTLSSIFISCNRMHRQIHADSKVGIAIDSTIILKPLDTLQNDYCIYIVRKLPMIIGHDLLYDTVTSYYSCDARKVAQKILSFKGSPVDYMLKCSYDYNLYLTLKDSVIQSASINSWCNFVYSDNGAFILDSLAFNNLTAGLKRLAVRDYEPTQIKSAREERRKLSATMPLALQNGLEPEWIRYDGYFYLEKEQADNRSDSVLINYIHLTYPNDTFAISDDVREIKSSKIFYTKFNLLKKGAWTAYSRFRFTVINKQEE